MKPKIGFLVVTQLQLSEIRRNFSYRLKIFFMPQVLIMPNITKVLLIENVFTCQNFLIHREYSSFKMKICIALK